METPAPHSQTANQAGLAGAVAAGHPDTADAAMAILHDGGNAFDAALAGLLAACIAEPVLASLGGGGFLTARKAGDSEATVFDFFTQTPKACKPAEAADFFPITADFGSVQQVFHIGMGSIATPGVVAGIFAAHRALGRAPLARIIEPAQVLARAGVRINRLQAYIFQVVGAIYRSNERVRGLYCRPSGSDRVMGEGDRFADPAFADTLDALVREGPALFYRGEIAETIRCDCQALGGHLGASDLADYDVIRRPALRIDALGGRLFTNPGPSTGGVLVGLGLKLVEGADWLSAPWGSADHMVGLARCMGLVNRARRESPDPLDPLVVDHLKRSRSAPQVSRGTTHISVVDADGNAAALSVSNGEGSGYMIPGTGIMLNNMLGEEDINPTGFHCWPSDQRMGSMMAPSLLESDVGLLALGSGGSNRIRSAIWQVLQNVLAFAMSPAEAITAPRLHLEGLGDGLDQLSIEGGLDAVVADLAHEFVNHDQWEGLNLFFGGVHGVLRTPDGTFSGAGDPRRGGVFRAG